jgi:orotate phosphoribosyltransferase
MATEVQTDGSVKDVPHSAVQYVRNTLGMSVCCIAELSDLLTYLSTQTGSQISQHLPRVQAYRDRYGV